MAEEYSHIHTYIYVYVYIYIHIRICGGVGGFMVFGL